MATSPEGIMALGQPAEAGEPPSSIQISRNEAYDISRQALNEARPDVAMELEERLAGFREKARQLPVDVLEALVDVFEEALNRKDDYAAFLEEAKQEVPDLLSLFPPEYDESFLSAMYFLFVDALRAREGEEDIGQGIGAITPQKFAMGGIAEAARLVASQGRRGDTMLAHINPQEAQLLKALGGAGTINPRTGLPEYNRFKKALRKLGDATIGEVKAVVDDFVSDARDFVRSDVGGVVTQIGLTIALTPFVGPVGAASIASGATTAFRGGDLKEIALNAALAAATAYLSQPDTPIYDFIGKHTPAFMNNDVVKAALTAQVVGTGAGVLQGQSLSDAAKNGLRDAAITAATTYASGGTKAQAKDAASASMANAVDGQIAKGATGDLGITPLDVEPSGLAALTPEQVQAAQVAPPPDMPTIIGDSTRKLLDEAAGLSTVPVDAGFDARALLAAESNYDLAPSASGAPGTSRYLVDAQGRAIANAPPLEYPVTGPNAPDVGTYQPKPVPLQLSGDPRAFASYDTNPVLSGVDEAKRAAVSGLSLGDTTFGDISPMTIADVPSGGSAVPGGGIGSLKKVPSVMESLGKIAKGDVLEGVGDLFMPSGPSTKDIIDSPEFAQLTKSKAEGGAGLSGDAALKALQESKDYNPNFMRTYGPATAALTTGIALAGGFKPQDPPKTEEQQRYEEQMRKSISETIEGSPREYLVQNLPGIQYDEKGRIVGSFTPPPAYTLEDVMADQRAPTAYSSYQAQAPLPPVFMSPYGEQYLNQGGIAGLRAGGYPRRIGQISGPGTETSDSIPAMLSDGEFVMTARAVRGMGNGSRREGARKMYALMHKLENNASRG